MACKVCKYISSQPVVGTAFVTYNLPVCTCCLKSNSLFRVVIPLASASTLPVEFITCDGRIHSVIKTSDGTAVTASGLLANVDYICTLECTASGYQVQITNL